MRADAGLYAKPEPGRKLGEGGVAPLITLFSLPQTVTRALSSVSAFLGDLPDELQESKGWGVALPVLQSSILATLADLVYTNSAGKDCIVIGMHVQHAPR